MSIYCCSNYLYYDDMMIAEVLFGCISNSMALLADGGHMGTHAFALRLSLVAYV